MHIKRVFELLRDTELNQIYVNTENNTEILSYLNFALIKFYSNMAMEEASHIINIEKQQTMYRLPDNLNNILEIYDNKTGKDIPLNDENKDGSIFTRGAKNLFVPPDTKYTSISIWHTVTPPFITNENLDTIDFHIPDAYVEPLINYAGYRASVAQNPDDRSVTGSMYRRFKGSLNDAISANPTHRRASNTLRLTLDGFE